MWNKLFGKNNKETPENKNNTLLSKVSGFSKKVLKQLKVAPLAVAGILAGCATTGNNNQVDIEENLDNANGAYTLQVENNSIDLDSNKIATANDVLSALGPVIVKDEYGNEISDNLEAEELIEYKEFHIPKKGEWFHSIARHYNIDPYELIELNRPYLDNVDIIPLDYKVKLGNLVPLNFDDNNSSITENKDYSLLSQAETQVSDVNVSIEGESIELIQNEIVNDNIESEKLDITKTYEVSEGENLYSIARKQGIPYLTLKKYNNHLRRFDEKSGVYVYVVYPTKKIFLEAPNLESKHDIEIINDHHNYVADINNYKEWKNKYMDEWNQTYGEDSPAIVVNQTPSIEQEVKDGIKRHTVRDGEYLGLIAQSYHVTINQIEELNGINRKDNLPLGKVLKIPEPNRNLASYVSLNEEEFKQKFYENIKYYIANIPGFLVKIDQFVFHDGYSQYNDADLLSVDMDDSFDYLIDGLYEIEPKKRDSFIRSLVHPDTLDSEKVYGDLVKRKDQTQCGAAMRDILRITHDDRNVNTSGMNANRYVPYFEESQDYLAVSISSINDIKPGASLVYDPGYGTGDRYDVGHVEYYVGEHNGQHRFAHITSNKYGKTFPYPGGSLNSYVQEAGLRNTVYYHKSLFDPNYVNTNMTKAEYVAYQETQREERIASVQVKPDENIVRTKKYIQAFAQVDPTVENANFVLRNLGNDDMSSQECLSLFSDKCIEVLKKQKVAGLTKDDPAVQEYFNLYKNSQRLLKHAQNQTQSDGYGVLKSAED